MHAGCGPSSVDLPTIPPEPSARAALNEQLRAAIRAKSVDKVRRLTESGAELNQPNLWGHTTGTPLTLAVQVGSAELVRVLLDHGAKVNLRSGGFDGTPPILLAAAHGNVEIVKTLIDAGAEVNARRGDSTDALFWACVHGHTAVIRLLLLNGAQIRSRHLSEAISGGHLDSVRTLIDFHAELSWLSSGRTMLEIAEQSRSANRVKMISLIRKHLARSTKAR
jgi:ankyrin repeat protein